MKVSKLSAEIAADFLRLDPDDYNEDEWKKELSKVKMKLDSAISYVVNYTGMPIKSRKTDNLDRHDEITHAVLVLVQDMYDNRSISVKDGNVNKVVSSILDMHCKNLL